MRKDVEARLGRGDRQRLEAVLADRNSAQIPAWRARIILATAAGCGTAEIMHRAGVSKPSVWRSATLHGGGGCRWAAARQDPQARQDTGGHRPWWRAVARA